MADYKDSDGKEIIEHLSENEPIELIQDTSYPYDQFAISVWSSDPIQLGYVPDIISPLISHKLDDKPARAIFQVLVDFFQSFRLLCRLKKIAQAFYRALIH